MTFGCILWKKKKSLRLLANSGVERMSSNVCLCSIKKEKKEKNQEKKCTWLFESALFSIVSIGCLSVHMNVEGSCGCYRSFMLCFSSFQTHGQSFSFFFSHSYGDSAFMFPSSEMARSLPLSLSCSGILHRSHASSFVVVQPVSCLKNTASRYYLPPKAKTEKQCKYRFMFVMVSSVGNVSFLFISLSFIFFNQNLSVFLRLTSFTALLTFRVRRRIFIKDVWKLLLSHAKVWCSV